MGASSFLAKPFEEEDAVNALNSVLRADSNSKKNLDSEYYRINLEDFISGKILPCSIHLRLSEYKYVKVAHAG